MVSNLSTQIGTITAELQIGLVDEGSFDPHKQKITHMWGE